MESGPERWRTKPSLPSPPTGARSHPVANASSARFSSTEKEWTTSQNQRTRAEVVVGRAAHQLLQLLGREKGKARPVAQGEEAAAEGVEAGGAHGWVSGAGHICPPPHPPGTEPTRAGRQGTRVRRAAHVFAPLHQLGYGRLPVCGGGHREVGAEGRLYVALEGEQLAQPAPQLRLDLRQAEARRGSTRVVAKRRPPVRWSAPPPAVAPKPLAPPHLLELPQPGLVSEQPRVEQRRELEVEDEPVVDGQPDRQPHEQKVGARILHQAVAREPEAARLLVPLEEPVVTAQKGLDQQLEKLLAHTALVDGGLALKDDADGLEQFERSGKRQRAQRVLHQVRAPHAQDQVRGSRLVGRAVGGARRTATRRAALLGPSAQQPVAAGVRPLPGQQHGLLQRAAGGARGLGPEEGVAEGDLL
eukprot:scaffold15633_cov107-Isochrysis_galbana.AAC.12